MHFKILKKMGNENGQDFQTTWNLPSEWEIAASWQLADQADKKTVSGDGPVTLILITAHGAPHLTATTTGCAHSTRQRRHGYKNNTPDGKCSQELARLNYDHITLLRTLIMEKEEKLK